MPAERRTSNVTGGFLCAWINISGNYVHENGDAGMALMESFNADVSDNTFEKNKYGIRMSVGCVLQQPHHGLDQVKAVAQFNEQRRAGHCFVVDPPPAPSFVSFHSVSSRPAICLRRHSHDFVPQRPRVDCGNPSPPGTVGRLTASVYTHFEIKPCYPNTLGIGSRSQVQCLHVRGV